jgi:uncharacterized protein (DUF1330 family)
MRGPVYYVSTDDITDPERFEEEYLPGAMPLFMAAGAELLVIDMDTEQLEGDSPGRTVAMRFPSEEASRGRYESEEYVLVRKIRMASTANDSASWRISSRCRPSDPDHLTAPSIRSPRIARQSPRSGCAAPSARNYCRRVALGKDRLGIP